MIPKQFTSVFKLNALRAAMVESLSVTKVLSRDKLVLDVDVWMLHPDDHDFTPRLALNGTNLTIRTATGTEIAHVELDPKALELAQRDLLAEMRVKFQVRGMHQQLNIRQPQLMDGAANVKKLATPRWKTTLPIQVS